MKIFCRENAILKSHLGLCAAVAVTTTVMGGFAIGIMTLVVLTMQMLILSIVAKRLCTSCRVFVSLMVGAGLASLAEIFLQAYFYEISITLGWYIPLIAVSGIIVVLVPQAADETVGRAAAKGFVVGLGYTLVLLIVSAVRELFGYGSIFGINLGFKPMALITTPFGGFFVLGLVMALLQWLCSDKNNTGVAK